MTDFFEEVVDRKRTNSLKWSAGEEVLPMWIADMDFKTAPVIMDALQQRMKQGIFGYTATPAAFYEAITGWWRKRHGFEVQKAWIGAASGVLPALAATMRALFTEGDKIIIQPPVYNHFYETIAASGYQLVENNLLLSGEGYRIDFEDLAEKAADPAVKLLLLCNPHNPVGRVWTREELQRIGDICLQHQVRVLSDEIHSDLVYGENKHVPFASLGTAYSRNAVTYCSPSKTFNLAGLQVGYFFTENKVLKDAVTAVLNKQEMLFVNVFAIEALIAAYTMGEEWLEALKAYVYSNYEYLCEFSRTHFPLYRPSLLQATYLVWLDCSASGISSKELADKLLKQAGLWVSPGFQYGAAGEYFIRINIACPRALLTEGLLRLAKVLEATG